MLPLSELFGPNEKLEEFYWRCKFINYKSFDSKLIFYRYCLACSRGGWAYPMSRFKEWFPDDYKYLTSMIQKRSVTKRNIEFMLWAKPEAVYFGDLTYDDNKINRDVKLRRKMAQRHLNKYFDVYMLFEEYGTQNTCRYHVHFVGILKSGFKAKDVRDNWDSFSKCKFVRSSRGVARYLTDYSTKQVPRIRRNKKLVALERRYKELEFTTLHDSREWCAEMSEMFDNLPF